MLIPVTYKKENLSLLNNNNDTSNKEDCNMAIINETRDNNTSRPTTAESPPAQNSILSLVELPFFFNKIIGSVQCPISYDTAKIPAYA